MKRARQLRAKRPCVNEIGLRCMHARPSLRVPLPLLHPGQTVLHGHGKADGNREEVTAGQRAGKGQMDVSSGWQWCGRCVEAENDTKKIGRKSMPRTLTSSSGLPASAGRTRQHCDASLLQTWSRVGTAGSSRCQAKRAEIKPACRPSVVVCWPSEEKVAVVSSGRGGDVDKEEEDWCKTDEVAS